MATWKAGHDTDTVWKQLEDAMATLLDDDLFSTFVINIAKQLAKLTLQNVNLVAKSDREMKRELNAPNSMTRIGDGLAHGHTDCHRDSLLQVIAAICMASNSLENQSICEYYLKVF